MSLEDPTKKSAEGNSSEQANQSSESAGIAAEEEKIKKLGLLDFEAKSIAAEDRAAAETILTRLKDASAERTLETHEMLVKVEEDARRALELQQGLRVGGDTSILDSPLRAGNGKYQSAVAEWERAKKALLDYEAAAHTTVEELAHEKNPIVHKDHEGHAKRDAAALVAPIVRFFPTSFFRGKNR